METYVSQNNGPNFIDLKIQGPNDEELSEIRLNGNYNLQKGDISDN